MIVVDNTVMVDFWAGEEPFRTEAENLFRLDSDWIAPGLWFYEFGNVISKLVKFDRISKSIKEQAWRDSSEMVRLIHDIDFSGVDRLVSSKGLSFYDASYVWLAYNQGVKLYTRDKQILRECPEVACCLKMMA